MNRLLCQGVILAVSVAWVGPLCPWMEPSVAYGQTSGASSAVTQIQKANNLAQQGDFEQATALYESALKTMGPSHPEYSRVQKNMTVLYFNWGAQLQKEKQYTLATQQFNKVLSLSPGDAHAKKGLAANHFYQAMDLLESGSTDYPAMHAHLAKAVELDPSEPAFQNRRTYLWMQEAQTMADGGDIDGAIALIEKAQQAKPDDANTKTSLANLYLQKARQEKGKKEKQAWIDKALAMDNSPTMQGIASQVKNEGKRSLFAPKTPKASAGAGAAMNHPFVHQQGMGGGHQANRDMSVFEMLNAIERHLESAEEQGVNPTEAAETGEGTKTLVERVESAEMAVYGKVEEGPLALRAKTLYTALLGGAPPTVAAQSDTLQGKMGAMAASPSATGDSYIGDVLKMTDGKVIRWGRFPLRVFIHDPGKDKPVGYRDTYPAEIVKALDTWKESTNGFVDYVLVKNNQASDIQFLWDEKYEDEYSEGLESDQASELQNLAVPKGSKLARVLGIASMFTPGVFYLAPQLASAALDYRQMKKFQVLIDQGKMTIGTGKTADMPEDLAHIYIQNMAAKEIGHVLGLKTASHLPTDITHPKISYEEIKPPSARDIATLQDLYGRPATIVLNVR